MLAHFYGWTEGYILSLPMRKLKLYAQEMGEIEQLDYFIELQIAHNPYSKEPEILWRELKPNKEPRTVKTLSPDRQKAKERIEKMIKESNV